MAFQTDLGISVESEMLFDPSPKGHGSGENYDEGSDILDQ